MIGDNIYVHVEFSKPEQKKKINNKVIEALSCFFEKQKITVKEEDESFIEILIDYKNDYNVPANFYLSYISEEKNKIKMISLSAFNHPAGEFLLDNGKTLCKQLFKDEMISKIILTDDSEYSTEEIIEKLKESLNEVDITTLLIK